MKKLTNIEFYNTPADHVEMRDSEGVWTYKKVDIELLTLEEMELLSEKKRVRCNTELL